MRRLELVATSALTWTLLSAQVACSDGTFHSLVSAGHGPRAGDDQSSDQTRDSGETDTSGGDDGDDGDNGSDEPTWVNGSYLTCTWIEAASATDATVGCGLHDATGALVRPEFDLEWDAQLADGTSLASTLTAANDTANITLTLDGTALPDLELIVAAASGIAAPPPSLVLQRVAFIDLLPGFREPVSLADCLRDSGAVIACLDAVGITIADASGGAPAPPATRSRAVVGGIAYYLGLPGESCTEACSGNGGVNGATLSVVGSGGTALGCVDALAALVTISVLDNQTAAQGIGCHAAANGDGLRVTTPATTQEAKTPDSQRVCACQQ